MSGLSVLLPIYNRDVTRLVEMLAQQARQWPGPVEILCFDDGSEDAVRALNRPMVAWAGVVYHELPANIGRSAIRNRLAAAAQHPWLLLLDNNISLPDDQFLARYATALATAPVLVGGTTYAAEAPTGPQLLRWHYGRLREARAAKSRQRQPYAQFNLKNVLMRADVFRGIGLDEHLTRYGHEDTKLGWALQEQQVHVHHLDNPVLHDALEPAAEFLRKSRQAVLNLAQLYRAEGLGTDTKLLRSALRLRKMGLDQAFCRGFALVQRRVRRQLLQGVPGSLRQFDALKLYWLLLALGRTRKVVS
ncbi:glycosyltransferase family 2 protein [Hymenobacter lutimineralis]|uniref:Glycosyltransferase family 2 protein n=1 Tax=Hymenobacter lutimineralis TaxID=2606448 RepID=A0A5D6V5V3_9BACT|nr:MULTISPECIES: glycosyltransferase [Hymenobacter]QIX63032.1 glycosyltransferase family 2 protein [Hymenobacter sp. BT18]TYZ10522.1 glycosyltransferase family 2 protein [Hymenobacter lutimineralis]